MLDGQNTETLEHSISTGSGDAEERAAGGVNRSSRDLELGFHKGINQAVGLRFENIMIPRGATVASAYIQFKADEVDAEATTLIIHGEASDNSAVFRAKKYNLTSRPKTQASVAWSPEPWNKAGERGEAQKTTDLAVVLQEIVNRDGWQRGNALTLIVQGESSGKRVAESFNGDPAGAATLQITFEASDTPPEPTPPEPTDPTPAPTPDPTPASNVALPARAAFYYPWFPETWTVGGQEVFYTPTLGKYNSDSQTVADAHIGALDYAKVDVAIASWWGPGTHKEDVRVPLLLERTGTANSDLKWAAYYEKEGFGDPSLSELQTDLSYLEANYTAYPAYARVNGKPVIFVYNADDSSCEVAERWAQATGNKWYVVLKVFAGFRNCANQPESWHQYAPAAPTDQQSGYSYAVSPGFWRADEVAPRLTRDLARFQQNVRDMVASGEPWQLVTTFNEWGEGSAIEEAKEWGKAYLETLATDGSGESPPPEPAPTVSISISPQGAALATLESTSFTATVSGVSNTGVTWDATGGSINGSGNTITYTAPDSAGSYSLTATSVADPSVAASALVSVTASEPPPSGNTVTFAAAGDFGGQEILGGVLLDEIAVRGDVDAFFLLGDVTYGQKSAGGWCDWVHGKLGATFPMQLVGGNHEDDGSSDGFILDFTSCMPDRLESNLGPGGYGVSYASDMGPVTVIMTSPDLRVDGVTYSYSGGAQQSWLVEQIRGAKSEGDWVVVGMHKNCVTMGQKGCEIGQAFAQLLVAEKVDLVLQGHDHTYQRSHSLAQIQAGSVPSGAVADNGDDDSYRRGAGTVFVISGMVGRSLYGCNHADPEAPYFAAHHCSEEGEVRGYLLLDASATELSARYVALPNWGAFNDTFSIR